MRISILFISVFVCFISVSLAHAQTGDGNKVVVIPLLGEDEPGIIYSAQAPIVITTPDPSKPNEQLISFTAPADQVVDLMQPSLGLNYVIALQGIFPSRNLGNDDYLASVDLFAGNFAPRGYAFCDGQLLPIAQNSALFALLGTTYGGDGRTTFGLPDLRGRVAVGSNGNGPGLTDRRLGDKFGSESVTVDHR